MQALQRLEHGEAKEKIDEAARAFGMPMGPVELADWVGLDVCALVGRILGIAPAGSSRLDEMVAAGKLGRKSGEGFYVWKDGRAEKGEPPQVPYDRFELERLGRELVDPLIGEAQKALDEGIVENADLVDAGVVFGTGFAPFRGGPLHFKRNEQRSNVEPLRRSAAE
jgi:3-hydroxyacyl-CoA dehydrogenase/enoyl-CoA hydratase/3-hydroxybutyryl-CoA epimerase